MGAQQARNSTPEHHAGQAALLGRLQHAARAGHGFGSLVETLQAARGKEDSL